MENKEFFAALTDLVREKGISEEAFIATLENALASAYKKQFDGGAEVSVSLNAEKGTIEFKATRYVVEEVEDKDKEISLEDLSEVSGGAAFANIPRVPTREIDKTLKDKI